MMDCQVWDDYRGRIDIAVIASAWPEFACRNSGRKHRLFGHVGPMAIAIPTEVSRDLDVPVIFANQTGATRTSIPIVGLTFAMHITDRFAGHSSVCGGRSAAPVIADSAQQVVVSLVTVADVHKSCS
jgi:N-carbamoylputrescine amidase